MISSLTSFFQKPAAKGPALPRHDYDSPLKKRNDPSRQSFSKVFRWKLPENQAAEPNSVEVVGSFTRWEKVELKKDKIMNAWTVTVQQIPGNRTHHYVFLVNGEPVADAHCDGLAVPSSAEESQYQLQTNKGPRVCMLFANTK